MLEFASNHVWDIALSIVFLFVGMGVAYLVGKLANRRSSSASANDRDRP